MLKLRILKLSKIFQAIFENENEDDLNIVPLSKKYSNFFVKPIVRLSLINLVNNFKDTQAISVFRILIPNFLDISTKTVKQIKFAILI